MDGNACKCIEGAMTDGEHHELWCPVIKWASEDEIAEHFDAEINREWESWLKVQEVAE